MPLSVRENYLRNASMRGHEWIPVRVHISGASWRQDPAGFEKVCRSHPTIFPNFRKPPIDSPSPLRPGKGKVAVDEWGSTVQLPRAPVSLEGLTGQVVQSPLDDWAKLESWTPPEPPAFDERKRLALAEARAKGRITSCSLGHGFFFMRLFYLRGYDSFMMDVATGEPRLEALAEIVTRYNERLIAPYVEAGIDLLNGGDDLGTQTNSMLGPRHFRRWVLPAYQRLFTPARAAGAHVHLHSDGYLMDILDEIVECGVTIINPQDLVNGIDALAREVKGRICIDLDVDRQKILPFGGAAEIRDLIRQEVMKLGSPAGGLQFTAGIYPPTPARNVDALCAALEAHRTYWVGR